VPDLDVLAVVAATVAAFVLGGTYYGVLGDRLATISSRGETSTPPWTYAAELLRCLVLSAVVAGLAVESGTDDWFGGLALGLALWIGFPVVLWVGALVHERSPWQLAAIHAGDWLLKLLAVGVIVSAWQ
jgi:hypothetical protein